MPYYMVLKIEVDKSDLFPAALENVGKDIISGMPECHSTVGGNIVYNFVTYKSDTQETVNVKSLRKDETCR